MKTRISAKVCLLVVVLAQLSGCIMTPRIEIEDKMTFDAIQPEPKPLTYNDTLCCWRCTA
jgi:hypothetical protein